MLNKQQFLFNKHKFDVNPQKMDFNQFTQSADYHHGKTSYHGPNALDWNEDSPETHAGTQQAAIDRIAPSSGSHKGIFPLRHVGEYVRGHFGGDKIGEDMGSTWGQTLREANGRTQKYRNSVEDAGSISAVGPASNFQTYHQYVDSRANPTWKQQMERPGRAYVPFEKEPDRQGPVPGQRQLFSPKLPAFLDGQLKKPLPK